MTGWNLHFILRYFTLLVICLLLFILYSLISSFYAYFVSPVEQHFRIPRHGRPVIMDSKKQAMRLPILSPPFIHYTGKIHSLRPRY
jgi:hypothetical protein